MLKIDSAGTPACGRALGCAKSTFFGNRLVVCQITSKNGADYKNDVVAGEQTRAERGFLRVFNNKSCNKVNEVSRILKFKFQIGFMNFD